MKTTFQIALSVILLSSCSFLYAGLSKPPQPGTGIWMYNADVLTQSADNYSNYVTNRYPNATSVKAQWYIYLGGICTLYGKSSAACGNNDFCLLSVYADAVQPERAHANTSISNQALSSSQGSVPKKFQLTSHQCEYIPTLPNDDPVFPTTSVYGLVSLLKGDQAWIPNASVLIGIEVDSSVYDYMQKYTADDYQQIANLVGLSVSATKADGVIFDLEGGTVNQYGAQMMQAVSAAIGASDLLVVSSASAGGKVDSSAGDCWDFWSALNRTTGCDGGKTAATNCQKGFWLMTGYDNTPVTYNVNNVFGQGDIYSFNASLWQYPYTLKYMSNIPAQINANSTGATPTCGAFPKTGAYFQYALSAGGSESQAPQYIALNGKTPFDGGTSKIPSPGYLWGAGPATSPVGIPKGKSYIPAIKTIYFKQLSGQSCQKLFPGKGCNVYQQSLPGLDNIDDLAASYLCVGLSGVTYYYGQKKLDSSQQVEMTFGDNPPVLVPDLCSIPNDYGQQTVNNKPLGIYYFNDQTFVKYPDALDEIKSNQYFLGVTLYHITRPNQVVLNCMENFSDACDLIPLPVQIYGNTWDMYLNWAQSWYGGDPVYPDYPSSSADGG